LFGYSGNGFIFGVGNIIRGNDKGISLHINELVTRLLTEIDSNENKPNYNEYFD